MHCIYLVIKNMLFRYQLLLMHLSNQFSGTNTVNCVMETWCLRLYKNAAFRTEMSTPICSVYPRKCRITRNRYRQWTSTRTLIRASWHLCHKPLPVSIAAEPNTCHGRLAQHKEMSPGLGHIHVQFEFDTHMWVIMWDCSSDAHNYKYPQQQAKHKDAV